MKKIAVFPGSFDPFTKGHENLVAKAKKIFDEIVIAIGVNSSKKSLFSDELKLKHIESLYTNDTQIKVLTYQKLTTELCQELGANFIVRGLRDVKDFEYERSIAQMNHALNASIESVFIISDPEFNHINSTIVREISKNGGIIDAFVTNSKILV